MSQCHVHSHLNPMSALQRQQVGLNAGGWYASIQPSFLPTMPVMPQQSTPSTTCLMTDPVAHNQQSKLFFTWEFTRNLVIQRWIVPFCTSACFSGVTLEAAEKDRTWRHCIEISMQRRVFVSVRYSKYAPVPSVYHDIINIIFGIHRGITEAPHL